MQRSEQEEMALSRSNIGVWGDQIRDHGTDEDPVLGRIEQLGEYEPGNSIHGIIGWDGFFVLSEALDVVDMARAYMQVVQRESCGKCVPCRVGSRVAAEILERIADGRGQQATSIHCALLAT